LKGFLLSEVVWFDKKLSLLEDSVPLPSEWGGDGEGSLLSFANDELAKFIPTPTTETVESA